MIKYIICPGHVRSKTGGALHWISAHNLMLLYKVDPSECCVKPTTSSGREQWVPPPGAIELHPDFYGNYKLPTK